MNISSLKDLLSYNPETGELHWVAKGKGKIKKKAAGTITYAGYVGVMIEGKRIQAHRIAWALHTGEWPKDQIDHINGIKTDNRIANLREATNAQNGKNLPVSKSNKTGVPGVCFDSQTGKWRAYIRVDHKMMNLGRFTDFDAAVRCRKQAEEIHFGLWARSAA